MNNRLLIITSFYPGGNRGNGPWSERYQGLYGPLFRREGSSAFRHVGWYDLSTGQLHEMSDEGVTASPIGLFPLLMKELERSISGRGNNSLLIAYPAFKAKEVIRAFRFIALINLLRLVGKARVCLDFIDPQVIMTDLYMSRSFLRKAALGLLCLQEKSFLASSDVVITNSAEMGVFLRANYQVKRARFEAIPMGVHVADFSVCSGASPRKCFTIVYGGAISEERGMADLFECIERIRREHSVSLICCGRVHPSLKIPEVPWLEVISDLDYHGYVNVLCNRADAGIIPYPVNEWWGRVSISKFATYAAAGIPIISTDLQHTADLIRKWECGLVGTSWEEMAGLIVRLKKDRNMCLQLGKNARKAAERFLDWPVQADAVSGIIGGNWIENPA